MSKLRIAIGVAAEREDGWRPYSETELDATSEAAWLKHFEPGTIDNIVAEHVWEHLTWTQARAATSICHRFLRPGGRLRLAVPDTLHASAYIVDAVSATGSRAAEHNHIVDYHHELMRRLLEGCGFTVEPRDWWDRDGAFHNGYSGSDEHGYIIRSFANWPKHPSVYRDPEVYTQIVNSVPSPLQDDFVKRRIEHTSLIVDGIKAP